VEGYRVVGEQIPDGRRIYWFMSEGDGSAFRRSCSVADAPFKVGGRYSRDEIDAGCPAEPRRSLVVS
jgi:hypothetical protein